MKIMFTLPWSDHVKERGFPIPNWKLPVPRKGESVKLYATYEGEREGLKLSYKGDLILCHFHVERISYEEDSDVVEVTLSFTAPVILRD